MPLAAAAPVSPCPMVASSALLSRAALAMRFFFLPLLLPRRLNPSRRTCCSGGGGGGGSCSGGGSGGGRKGMCPPWRRSVAMVGGLSSPRWCSLPVLQAYLPKKARAAAGPGGARRLLYHPNSLRVHASSYLASSLNMVQEGPQEIEPGTKKTHREATVNNYRSSLHVFYDFRTTYSFTVPPLAWRG